MYAGLSLFIIVGPYLYVVVCVVYAYNLAGSWNGDVAICTEGEGHSISKIMKTDMKTC